MTEPGLAWFARHELRLAWRDLAVILSRRDGKRRVGAILWIVVFVAFLHLVGYGLVFDHVRDGIVPDPSTLTFVSGSVLLSWCLLLSQAMESVTRAFYARGDLDLVLSSPAPSARLFAVRIAAIALAAAIMAMLLASPVTNVLVVLDGPRWLAAYGVAAALGAAAAAIAVVVTAALFRLLGPVRTRAVSQILAAVIGAAFAILVQGAAILSYGDPSRLSALTSDWLVARVPGPDSAVWWPARALLGDLRLLALVAALAALLLGAAILVVAPRFGRIALAAGSATAARPGRASPAVSFRRRTPSRVLREKEWTLLLRDPWLISQTLMQILYLIPAALLLWRSFGSGSHNLPVLVPVLVMGAGQLAGGLAWLAVSGEDAPDLVRTAPVAARTIVVAKIEAVLGAVAIVVAPLILILAVVSPETALLAVLGIAASAVSATAIQLWFRSQASRSQFRRRQTSSRVATFAEAFSSIMWACAATLAAKGLWPLAAIVALICAGMLGGVRALGPKPAGA